MPRVIPDGRHASKGRGGIIRMSLPRPALCAAGPNRFIDSFTQVNADPVASTDFPVPRFGAKTARGDTNMLSAKPSLHITSGNTDTPDSPDRRGADRVQTVFRVARVITALDEGLARIRNISDLGAGLRMPIPVDVSDALAVELADGVELRGHVIWVRDEEFGLRFDKPINCTELLAGLAVGARCGITRPVRLPVVATALARSERGLRKVHILDISQRGLKLMHDGSLTVGLRVQVTLPGGLDRQGIVRWTRGDRAGVMLLEPLSLETLGSARRLLKPTVALLRGPGAQTASPQP